MDFISALIAVLSIAIKFLSAGHNAVQHALSAELWQAKEKLMSLTHTRLWCSNRFLPQTKGFRIVVRVSHKFWYYLITWHIYKNPVDGFKIDWELFCKVCASSVLGWKTCSNQTSYKKLSHFTFLIMFYSFRRMFQ